MLTEGPLCGCGGEWGDMSLKGDGAGSGRCVRGSSASVLEALCLGLFGSSREESCHLLPGVGFGGLEQGCNPGC